MAAFEWLELQTLTSDISAARSRLAAARTQRDDRRVRVIEQEIAVAEARRTGLLAALSNHVATAAYADADDDAGTCGGAANATNDASISFLPDPPDHSRDTSADERAVLATHRRASLRAIGETNRTKGDAVMWDQLTPSDIDRAKREVETRRDEILARHAEELRDLEADREHLASLEAAITVFLSKFGQFATADNIVTLGVENQIAVG